MELRIGSRTIREPIRLSRRSIPDRTTEAATTEGKQLIESIGEAWTHKAIAEEASPGIGTDTSLSPGS
jgi:hypothetical protein